jgi:sulfate transport system ATP-binding protein
VFVTHDQEEALEVADRIVVMNHGVVEQIGSPQEVYDNPASPFVYQFLGNVNLFHSRVHEGIARIGEVELVLDGYQHAQDSEAVAYVRPHDIEILRHSDGNSSFQATINYIHAVGPVVRIELERHDTKAYVEAELTREHFDALKLIEGEAVYLRPHNLRVFLQN